MAKSGLEASHRLQLALLQDPIETHPWAGKPFSRHSLFPVSNLTLAWHSRRPFPLIPSLVPWEQSPIPAGSKLSGFQPGTLPRALGLSSRCSQGLRWKMHQWLGERRKEIWRLCSRASQIFLENGKISSGVGTLSYSTYCAFMFLYPTLQCKYTIWNKEKIFANFIYLLDFIFNDGI